MWLEGRFCSVAYLVCRFSSGVSQQKKVLCVTSGKSEKDLGKDKAECTGFFYHRFGMLPIQSLGGRAILMLDYQFTY